MRRPREQRDDAEQDGHRTEGEVAHRRLLAISSVKSTMVGDGDLSRFRIAKISQQHRMSA